MISLALKLGKEKIKNKNARTDRTGDKLNKTYETVNSNI
jgi:hypothetical protein